MSVSPLAGRKVEAADRADITTLVADYYTLQPAADEPTQRVSFGTSGHRGRSADRSFNEDHIIAVSQAIAEYRQANSITGPLFIGQDTHALSTPALRSAVEVLSANGVELIGQQGGGFTPTPSVSRAILTHNAAPGA